MNLKLILLFFVFFVCPITAQTQYNISTVVGGSVVGDGLIATSAKLNYPTGVTIHSNGEIYIADSGNHRIRKITTNGIISTIAGTGTAGYSGDGGLATSARLNNPYGVTIHSNGEIYIVDFSNHRIRKITTNGIISTIAGTGTYGYYGDGGLATSARLYSPSGVTINSNGEIYIVDSGNNRIRKITTNGIISTIAGTGTAGYSGDGGLATSAQLYFPAGVTVHSNGDIYIADYYNHRIRKITTNGIISTIAGTGTAGYSGDGGLATSAQLYYPYGVTINSNGDIYIADYSNNRIRKITTNGIISTIAGTGASGYNGDGGLATSAQLYFPAGVTIHSNGEIYIADYINHRIRKITTNGIISTVAGTADFGNNIPATLATSSPTGPPVLYDAKLVFADATGQVRQVDMATNIISKLASLSSPACVKYHNNELYVLYNNGLHLAKVTSVITILAGSGSVYGNSGDGGLATSAQLYSPSGGTINPNGDIYIADQNNHRIRKITTNGIISTIAGTGTAGYSGDGGLATSAQLYSPIGVTINSNGEIYIADQNNHRIRKITTNGIISTIAGTGTAGYNGDGGLATSAQLYYPYGVTVHSNGEIYIADSGNNRIRKITTNGIISTIAGTGTNGYNGDGGLATSAQLNSPKGVTVHSSGEIYIADYYNHRIRKITTNGIISTIAGTGTAGYSGDGGLATSAHLYSPMGVTINSNGEIYISDKSNHRIRKITTNGIISTIAGGIGDGGVATASYLSAATFEISAGGEIYISDQNNHRIRKITTNGIISTIAGTGTAGYYGDGGLATSAQLNYPTGVTINSNGDIYIADYYNHRIRKITTNGIISTIAGTGTAGYSGDGGLATSAQLYSPMGVTINSNGEIYIVDFSNHRIRKITTNGIISTIAGTGTNGYYGDGGLATSAQLYSPKGVAINSNGEIYISDAGNNRIRKLSPWCSGNAVLTDGYCEQQCFGITNKDPTVVCSGKGTCIGYNQCNCTVNYFGLKCDNFYCNGLLNNHSDVCSSQGTCISPNNCYCSYGYFGNNCEYFYCNSIPFNSSLVCSSVGTCIGLNNCSCNSGYSGSNCQDFYCYGTSSKNITVCSSNGICSSPNNCTCLAGYNGNNCENFECFNIHFSNSSVCSGRGKCFSPDNCTCDIGYYGPNCEMYDCYGLSKNNSSVCANHGICSSYNNCTCETDYYGIDCEIFNCYGISKISDKVCSAHGTCHSPNNCSCVDSYYGNNCNQYNCYDVHFLNSTVCSGRGKCFSPNNCTCDIGYYGPNCEMYDCYGLSKNNSNTCSGHGICTAFNNCTCRDGYYDFKCESFNCAGEKFTGQSLCQNNGTCSGPGNCVCPYQFGGARCEYFKCFSVTANEPKVCGGHGSCLSYNNCSCSENWFGEDCSITKCFNITSNSSDVCGGRGNCSDYDVCNCNIGYRGRECDHILCYGKIESDTLICSGNGECLSPNNCTCKIGYVGNECQYHEIYLNTSSAILFSFHDSLMKLLPNNSEIFSCNDIFEQSELMKFGENSSILCQWRKKSMIIYLGFDYLIERYSIIQTKFNFSMRVNSLTNDVSLKSCTLGYSSLTETSPLLDIVIRLNCDENLYGFKKLKSRWTCTQCTESISSLLNSYTNRTFIYIPISYTNNLNTIRGYKSINLQTFYSPNEDSNQKSLIREVKIQTYSKSLPPSYYWLSDNYDGNTYSCIGHNCIIETSLNSLNSSISYSFSGLFSLLNNDLYSKQMVRMINEYSEGILDSEFDSNMQVFGVQLKTYIFLPFSIESFKYTTFTNLDFVMTGINRTYPINSDITIELIIDDPYISKYTLSDYLVYSWECYKVSPFNKSLQLSNNLCTSTNSKLEEKDIQQILSFKEGEFLIRVLISSNKYFTLTVYKYEGYIELLDISNESPKIITDYIPAVFPSHKNIYLRNVVKSSTNVLFKWRLKQGKLNIETNNIIEEFLEKHTIYRNIMNNDIEIILNINNEIIIEGEVYEFELSTKNLNGFANVSISTRIDYSPRLFCNLENLKNENNFTSFESLMSINCIKLPYESISSFVMEFHSNNERIGVISNTPKRGLITRVPYSKNEITLVVKLQNLYGSIGVYKRNIVVGLPNYLVNDNSIRSRFDYILNQYQTIKNSKPLKIEISNEISSLLTLLIQNETFSNLSDNIFKELNENQIRSFNLMLIEMMKTTKSLQGITYKVDERIIQLILPINYKICNILQRTIIDDSLKLTFSNELENLLEWIYLGMNKAINYYPTFIYNDLLDNYYLEEITSLQNILSAIYENKLEEQDKLHKYDLQFIKLTGSSINNFSFVEDIEYTNLLDEKLISLTVSNFKVDMKLPSDFSKKISFNSKSKLFYSIKSFNSKSRDAPILGNKPTIDLSLLDDSYNIINVENINPPIIIKFQGLFTNNKTGINTTCVYYDNTIKQWTGRGLETLTIIQKRTDQYIYFDMECKSNHLSLFSIQELDYNTPITQIPTLSSRSTKDEFSNLLIIILSTVLPISFLVFIFIIILIIFIILLFKNKKKKTNELANTNIANIELDGFSNTDFPAEGSMFIQPLMSVSSNGTTSEAFNPLSRYSNLVRIGQGSFGSVFKALDSKTSSMKAIKVIKYSSMEELNNFMKEGTQLMNVNHPYILRVNEFFVSKDQLLCIDMDFYELGDLVKLTNVDFDCSEHLIKQIIHQMCQALDYIHCNMKIIHRDIKPSNIFLKSLENDNIHIIVADFGLAKSNIGSTNNSYAGTPNFYGKFFFKLLFYLHFLVS